MINRSYQCDWTDLKKSCCLYIINHPALSVYDYSQRLGVGVKLVRECFSSMNMPINKKPKDCVGVRVVKQSWDGDKVKHILIGFAHSYGLSFRRTAYGFAFFDEDNRKTSGYPLSAWRDMYNRNEIFEVLGIDS